MNDEHTAGERRPARERREQFCREFLRTMDPARAAAAAGQDDGFRLLRDKGVAARLERMRQTGLPTRADVLRRLGQLAFGQAGDAAKLAAAKPEELEALDLSAVAEMKLTDKGVEVKLVDRVRALTALWDLLAQGDDRAERFLRALESADAEEEP